MSAANTIDYSIVICTYNPDERILTRCLNAVKNLHVQDLKIEVLLVDNNSHPALPALDYIKSILSQWPSLNLLTVKAQGLTNARVAGIEASNGRMIVFFDDDNEPDPNYLLELAKVSSLHSQVAAWGPGQIQVDFIDGIDKTIENYGRESFQERNDQQVAYADLRSWQSCYPFGTGLCVRADILRAYHELVKQGAFSMTDRKGNQMSSGGDTQIVFYCIQQGYSAGISPGMKLVHIIPGKRANLAYLKRLAYGTGIAYTPLLVEIFPDQKAGVSDAIMDGTKFSRRTLKRYLKLGLNNSTDEIFSLISYIATNCGAYIAMGKQIPGLVGWIIKKLKLD